MNSKRRQQRLNRHKKRRKQKKLLLKKRHRTNKEQDAPHKNVSVNEISPCDNDGDGDANNSGFNINAFNSGDQNSTEGPEIKETHTVKGFNITAFNASENNEEGD